MKLIIFDFDGTLVDSRKLIIESHRVIFGEYGFSPPLEEESLSLIGMPLEIVLLQLAGPDAPVENMAAAYQRLLPQLRPDLSFADAPFDGAAPLLAALSGHNDVRLGIATGHVSHAISPALERFGWRNFFAPFRLPTRHPQSRIPQWYFRR